MDPKDLIRVLISRLEKRWDWRAETTSALGSLKSRRPCKALKMRRASHDGGGCRFQPVREVGGHSRLPSEGLLYKTVKQEKSATENDDDS